MSDPTAPTYTQQIITETTARVAKPLLEEIERLRAVIEKLPKDADGEPVEDGKPYWFPCANGTLMFFAYLGPQNDTLNPYPWGGAYSSEAKAEAAREKQ